MATPSADVQLRVAANSAAAQMDKFARDFKRMTQQMKDATSDANRTIKSQSGGTSPFSSWISDVTKVGAALLGVNGAVAAIQKVAQLVSNEFEAIQQRAEWASQRQVPYQLRLANMIHNLPSDEDPGAILAAVDGMIKSSNVANKQQLTAVLEAAASSTADMPYLERVKVGLAVAESRPDLLEQNVDALSALAQATVYNQRLFQKEGSTPLAQQGLLQSFKTATLIAGDQQAYQNLGKIGGQVRAVYGENYNQLEVMALTAALNLAAGDSEGAITNTQIFNFLGDLRNEFAKRKPDMADKSLFKQLKFLEGSDPTAQDIRHELLGSLEKRTAGETTPDEEAAILSALRGSEVEKAKITGRARSKFAIAQLLQAEGTDATVEGGIKHYLKSMSSGELPIVMDQSGEVDVAKSYARAEELMRKRIEFIQQAPQLESASLAVKFDTAAETADITSKEALLGMRREKFMPLLQRLGVSALDRSFIGVESWGSAGDPKSMAAFMAAQLEGRRRNLVSQEANSNEMAPAYFELGQNGIGGRWTLRRNRTERERDEYLSAVAGKVAPEDAQRFGMSEDTRALLNNVNQLINELREISSGRRTLSTKDTSKPKSQPAEAPAASLNRR